MNNNKNLLFFAFIFIIMSCSDIKEKMADESHKIKVTNNVDSISILDSYSDIEFIPFESKPNCLISHIKKLEVSKRGFYIMDISAKPSILYFDKNGRFIRKIGKYGKGKGEYQHLSDFSVSNNGDTIIIATYYGFNAYDYEGNFLFSKHIERGSIHSVQAFPKGYVYSSDFSGDTYCLHIMDFNLEQVKDLCATNGRVIPTFPLIYNSIRYNNNKLYYYNQYNSSLYIVDTEQMHNTEYCLQSNKIMNYDLFKDKDPYSVPFDAVTNYYVRNGFVHGNFLSNFNDYRFSFDEGGKTFLTYPDKDFTSQVLYADQKYDYYMLYQDEFIGFMDKISIQSPTTNNYESVKDSVTTLSNVVIMKCQLK